MPAAEPDPGAWPDAIVFDLDGTIADTAADIRNALNEALAAEQLAPVDLATVKTMIGAGPEVLVRRALQWQDVDDSNTAERVHRAFRAIYGRGRNLSSHLFPDVEPCLEELRGLGMRMGICSNKPESVCVDLLRDLGALHYFAAIQGFGSGLPPKPDPQPLLRTIERLAATPDRSLYVGDSETDVLTARAAGVMCALVSHGYTATPVDQLGGDWILDTLAALPGLCRQQRTD